MVPPPGEPVRTASTCWGCSACVCENITPCAVQKWGFSTMTANAPLALAAVCVAPLGSCTGRGLPFARGCLRGASWFLHGARAAVCHVQGLASVEVQFVR